MTIKLELTNPETQETKTYTQTFIPARSLRQVFKFMTEVEKGKKSEIEQLDGLVALVADLFKNPEVNFDTIYDGLQAHEIADRLNDVIMDVLGGFGNEGKHPAETK